MTARLRRRSAPLLAALMVAGGLTAVAGPAAVAAAVAPAAAPTVPAVRLPQLAVDDAAANRTGVGGTGVLSFRIRLLRPASSAVTVHYATKDGAAEAGTDYTATSGTATIPVGSVAPVVVPVRLIAARSPGAIRRMSLVLTRPSGARLERDTATGSVLGDAGTTPQIFVDDAAGYGQLAARGQVVFPVRLSVAATSTVTVRCDTFPVTSNPTVDYIPLTTTVTFRAGVTEVAVPVKLRAHARRAGSNFTLVCSNPVGAGVLRSTATGSILPGVVPFDGVALQNVVVVAGAGVQTAQVPVYLTGRTPPGIDIDVRYQLVWKNGDGPRGVGTATIPADSTSTTIPVSVDPRTWCTADDTPCGIRFAGDRPSSPQDYASVTIAPDAATAQTYVQQPHFASVEVGDVFRTHVDLDVPARGAQFTYTTVDGTAVAGRDYVARSGTFSAANGAGPSIDVLPGARGLGALSFTVKVTPVAPAVLAPGESGDVTVFIDPIDTFRPTGTIHESSGKPLPAGLQVFFDTYPTATQVPVDAGGNFALAGFTPLAATGHVVVPPGWTGNQDFSIPTAAGPGHVDLTVTSPI